VTDVTITNYFTACEWGASQEIIDAYAYNVTNSANVTAQLAIVDAYTATIAGTCALASGIPGNFTTFTNAKAWGAGMAVPVTGMMAYEGGPQGVANTLLAPSGNITGATIAASAVLTIPTANTDLTAIGAGAQTGNPIAVGMQLAIAGVGGMTCLNGATGTMGEPAGFVTATVVAGNNVTIDFNSGGCAAYTSGGTATISGGAADVQAMRMAFRQSGLLTNLTTQIYDAWAAAGGTFPSQLDLVDGCGVSNCWGVFPNDLYALPSPAYGAMIRWNH
jgi:hypothetical protein